MRVEIEPRESHSLSKYRQVSFHSLVRVLTSPIEPRGLNHQDDCRGRQNLYYNPPSTSGSAGREVSDLGSYTEVGSTPLKSAAFYWCARTKEAGRVSSGGAEALCHVSGPGVVGRILTPAVPTSAPAVLPGAETLIDETATNKPL